MENKVPNRLINEKSLYLRQHAHNPVDWYPWGEEAFARAAAEDKPVFISIGYSSCHWCHVMALECFENQKIADYLNEFFVSIKVDREERPDIDHVYMSSCQAVTGSGGWPLSVFAGHDKKPFYAGTYFPPPVFLQLLKNIVRLWQKKPFETFGKRRIDSCPHQIAGIQPGGDQLYRGRGRLFAFETKL